MKKLILPILLLAAVTAQADDTQTNETWTVSGKIYASKSEAVRAVISAGKKVEVTHTRCEILTNKLSFKACPKNKASNFDTAQFESIRPN